MHKAISHRDRGRSQVLLLADHVPGDIELADTRNHLLLVQAAGLGRQANKIAGND